LTIWVVNIVTLGDTAVKMSLKMETTYIVSWIMMGIMDVAPKPIAEVASRLRLLSCAIFEAYVSVDGRHVDYRSIQGSEEFKRLVLSLIDLIKLQSLKYTA